MEELSLILNGVVGKLVLPFVWKIISVIVVWGIGVKLIGLTRKILARTLERSHADKGVATFLDNFAKLGLYALLAVIIFAMFGFNTTGIAAAVASAGVAIGMALQGSLSNLAGGVLILLLKPFGIGDYIIADGVEGTVSSIQMFATKLMTGDNRMIVVPNGTLSNGTIINVSAMDKRRMDIPVGISYNADLKLAKDVLMSLLADCEYVSKEDDYIVFVNNLGSSSVELVVRCWATKENFWTAKWYLTEYIKLKLDEAGIEIPYNQLDVHLQTKEK